MNNELLNAKTKNLPANTKPVTFSQVGDKNIQVAHANQILTNMNIFMLNGFSNPASGQNEALSQLRFYLTNRSSEYYNFFVIKGEIFDNGRFFVPPDRALTESIDAGLKRQLASLSESAKARIKTFPSLFMSEIDRKEIGQTAYYGFVTDIIVQGNGIRIEFQKLCSLPQHKLNEIFHELALEGKPDCNELYRMHWTVKQIDLLEALRLAGLSVFRDI